MRAHARRHATQIGHIAHSGSKLNSISTAGPATTAHRLSYTHEHVQCSRAHTHTRTPPMSQQRERTHCCEQGVIENAQTLAYVRIQIDYDETGHLILDAVVSTILTRCVRKMNPPASN